MKESVSLNSLREYFNQHKKEVVLRMLETNMDVGLIAEITKLSLEHIESLKSFVPAEDVTGYITQGVANMKPCTAWIGEHVKYIK